MLALELSSPEAARRIRDEASTIARLEHPGIVPIHDIGELPDGRVFYTMKLVRGATLKDFAADHGRSELLRIFLRICDAVGFAHATGVIHRDLKPENIMVGDFGEVMVMDWGVAATIHAAGDVAGTRGFMSPEQVRGEPADQRTDIFALGAILEHMAADKPLRAIANKAKAATIADRYTSASELAADVARYLDGQPVGAYRENVLERAESSTV